MCVCAVFVFVDGLKKTRCGTGTGSINVLCTLLIKSKPCLSRVTVYSSPQACFNEEKTVKRNQSQDMSLCNLVFVTMEKACAVDAPMGAVFEV